MKFEAIKPRIFNAVAVGEIPHTDAPSRLITKSGSHRTAKLAEKFTKNKDCFVQIQSLFAFCESLSQVRAINDRPYGCFLFGFSKSRVTVGAIMDRPLPRQQTISVQTIGLPQTKQP